MDMGRVGAWRDWGRKNVNPAAVYEILKNL